MTSLAFFQIVKKMSWKRQKKRSEASPKEMIFTCHTDPFLQAHVTKILELVQIGEDITEV